MDGRAVNQYLSPLILGGINHHEQMIYPVFYRIRKFIFCSDFFSVPDGVQK